MATLTSILGTDTVASSRGVINSNFDALNTEVAGVNSSVLNTVRLVKTSDSSVISSTIIADDEIVLPIGANEIWSFQGAVLMSTAAAPDFQFGWTYPVGTTINWQQDDFADVVSTESDTRSITVTTTTPRLGGTYGVITASTVAGSVALRWAQNTNTPSSVTTLKAGTHLIANKLQ